MGPICYMESEENGVMPIYKLDDKQLFLKAGWTEISTKKFLEKTKERNAQIRAETQANPEPEKPKVDPEKVKEQLIAYYSELSVGELKALAEVKGLDSSGNKKVLIDRLSADR